ncbi:MAG: hypothetical protein GKR91_18160 [Pseudomonadales bacterium]|nr:hypothetical protein [Pseudomonadales bacterium]
MPHQIVEVSSNIESLLDLDRLVQALHHCAAEQEALALGGMRTRVYTASQTLIADESPDYGFIAVYLRIAEGRPEEVRKVMGTKLMECLCTFVDDNLGNVPLALSYEIQEIEADMRWNRNRVPEFMSSGENSS